MIELLIVCSMLILLNVYIFSKIKKGEFAFDLYSNEQRYGYSNQGYLANAIYIYLFVVSIVSITNVKLNFLDFSLFLTLTFALLLLDLFVVLMVHGSLLFKHIKYKRWCNRINLDINKQTNKYFILTNKSQYSDKDGLLKTSVTLYKVVFCMDWLGQCNNLIRCDILCMLNSGQATAENIKPYLDSWFKEHNTYIVSIDGNKNNKNNDEHEIIIVGN